jgi:LDH2 family malate/lactate/ureidoglycolate dehydrogenase
LLHIQPTDLRIFIKQAFIKTGVPDSEAEICAEILITSDLRGIESHGIGRLRMYIDRLLAGQIEPVAKPFIIMETPTSAVVDGGHGIGMVIAHQCMNMAIAKAREFGFGGVAVRNSTHFGIDGYYALMAAYAGMIGMSFTNARPSVSPTFSMQPMLGTNPIAFGAPTDEEFPFLYDAATSIIQRGKIEVLAREGKTVQQGWVIDDLGKSKNNPGEILQDLVSGRSALLPLGGDGETFGGHKGYGLSTIVEILSSCLQSGAFLLSLSGVDDNGNPSRFKVGHFFMAINIENFLPLEEFKQNIGSLLRQLRAAEKLPSHERIYTAGEKEYLMEKRVQTEGVPINENLRIDLLHIKEVLNLDSLHQVIPEGA